jgi:hypothetical protein
MKPARLSPAEAVAIAAEERDRRWKAWSAAVGAAAEDQREALVARALRDELLWFEIEMWARRLASDPEGHAHGWPRHLREALKSATLTANVARQHALAGKLPEAKALDLIHLCNWLAVTRPIPFREIVAERSAAA